MEKVMTSCFVVSKYQLFQWCYKNDKVQRPFLNWRIFNECVLTWWIPQLTRLEQMGDVPFGSKYYLVLNILEISKLKIINKVGKI